MAKLSSAESTKRQEQTSAWIFRRALNDNVLYKSESEILDDPKFILEVLGVDLKTGKSTGKGIYPEVLDTKNWMKTFYLQQSKFFKEFSHVKFTEFTRDGGFMKYISDLVKKEFKISKKDTWDPADIWCMQDEKRVMNEIQGVLKNHGLETLSQLNALLRTYFKDRIIVGVSLKMVTGNAAHYEEVNTKKGVLFENSAHPTFNVSSLKCDLNLRTDGSFKATGTSIDFIGSSPAGKRTYNISIRSISTSRFNNLSLSFVEKSAAAQIGRVPVEKLISEMNTFKLSYDKSNSNYPKNSSEYNTDMQKYTDMFNNIKNKVETGITNPADFNKNMIKIFSIDPVIGNTKLMQITFLNELVKLSDKSLDQFITNIFFLAEKRGEDFGPFGKLY